MLVLLARFQSSAVELENLNFCNNYYNLLN